MESCKILSRLVEMDEEITRQIETVSFSGKSMLYPIRRVRMTYYSRGPNTSDLSNFNILVGEEGTTIPRRIFVVLVKQSAMHGTLGEDPFYYRNCQLKDVSLRVAGQNVPFPEFFCNFATGNVLGPYFATLNACGAFLNEIDLGIDVSEFVKRSTILGFDLTASQLQPGEAFEMDKDKNIQLILRTHAPIAHAINVIIYAEYDAEIEIMSNKRVVKHLYA